MLTLRLSEGRGKLPSSKRSNPWPALEILFFLTIFFFAHFIVKNWHL